jgi:hypothetical protein
MRYVMTVVAVAYSICTVLLVYRVSKSTKCPHASGETISRPQKEADDDIVVAIVLVMDRSVLKKLFPPPGDEAKEATDGDLLRGGVELALDDCRWRLADAGDCKLLRREAALEEDLALDDKLFIIIPGMVRLLCVGMLLLLLLLG